MFAKTKIDVSNFVKRTTANEGINFSVTTFLFVFLGTFLVVKDKSTPTISGIVLLVFLAALYLGSVSSLALVAVTSFLAFSTSISIYRGFLNLPVSAFWSILIFVILTTMFIIMFKKILNVKIHWRLNLIAVLISLLSCYLVGDVRLFRRSGSISALYAWEDNADWILVVQQARNQNLNIEGGNYGSLMDTALWFSHFVSTSVFPTLTSPDHLATAVIIWTLLLVVSIPFLAILPAISHGISGKHAVVSTTALSIGASLAFLQLNSIGHLTAAIATLLLTIYLCIAFVSTESDKSSQAKYFLLFQQILLAYLAGVTWWPIVPLSATLIIFSIWSARKQVRTSKKIQFSFATLAIVLVYLLFSRQLFPRFNWANSHYAGDARLGILSGASKLLNVTGGNTQTEPWNAFVVTLFALVLLFALVTLGLKANAGLIAFTIIFAYVHSIKFINLRLYEGVTSYGSRKLDIVLVLVGISFLSWGLVTLFEKHLSVRISSLIPGLFIFAFLLSIPVAYAVIPGNYYNGLDWAPNVKTSKAISKQVKIGKPAVCLNETYQAETFSEIRLAAYICSRWTSAYSDTDSDQAYNWRLTVLGGGEPEALRAVSRALPVSTLLIVVGPEDVEREENNPEWDFLVQKTWRIER